MFQIKILILLATALALESPGRGGTFCRLPVSGSAVVTTGLAHDGRQCRRRDSGGGGVRGADGAGLVDVKESEEAVRTQASASGRS